MKSVIMSSAQRLQILKVLPEQLYPSTLKKAIRLDNITKISILYKKDPKQFTAVFRFYRKYGPSIRFYNPQIQMTRISDSNGPNIVNVKIETKIGQPVQITARQITNQQDLLQKIIGINNSKKDTVQSS